MDEVLKAIRECKNVFLEVVTPGTAVFLKVNKGDLVTQFTSREGVKLDNELEIVSQFGRDSVYLSAKVTNL